MSGTQTPVLSLYQTAELVAVVRNLKVPQQFLLKTFFPNVIESDMEEVAIDVDVGKRRLAPFCAPTSRSRLVESRTYSTGLFKPAYVKDKRNPDLLRPVRRQYGEMLLGGLSPQERMDANISFEMEDQMQMVDRRLEWMASSALQTGTILITGDGFATTLINYQRSPNLTIVLAGGARWGQTGVLPSQNIDDWATSILQESGAVATDIVFTNTPWKAFRADPEIKDSIYFPRGGDSNIEIGGGIAKGAMFKGVWGNYRLWLYNDWYVDPVEDIEYPMLPDGTVILSSPDLEGSRMFGLIKDPKFGYGALAYAPKMWLTEDPAQINLLMQSAPLVVPNRVNACLAATVCSPGATVVWGGGV